MAITPRTCGILLALVAACREGAPSSTGAHPGDTASEPTGTGTSGGTTDSATSDPGAPPCEGDTDQPPDESGCAPTPSDYRSRMSDDDMWPPCISDGGAYALVADAPSTIARVEAFESMADLLWRGAVPDEAAFTMARSLYAQDEGLESRLVRREDLHYDPIPSENFDPGVDPDKQCTVLANVEAFPDRCVGPARIAPIVQDAFAAGQTGEGNPAVHAARIEAGLLWFLVLSPYKECFTCTAVAKDCDSCWAYYTGGVARNGGLGLSREIRAASTITHDAIWDGILAVRCWRDLYPAADYPDLAAVPEDGRSLFETGWAQLDNALHRGLALIVRERLSRYRAACGADEGTWAFLQVLGPVLHREAAQRDAESASQLATFWAVPSPTMEAVEEARALLDRVFPCPQP